MKIEFPLLKGDSLLDGLKDIPRKVIIDKSDLGLCIDYFKNIYIDKSGWKSSLPFLIAMIVVCFTTTVDESRIQSLNQFTNLEITKNQFEFFFNMIAILSGIWLLKDLYKYFKSGNPYVKLFEKIQENSINKPDYTSIFLFKKKENEKIYILVEYKSSWKCFFLPYYKENSVFEKTDKDLKNILIRRIENLSENIEIMSCGINKHTEKYDPPENIVKDYKFTLYHVSKCNRLDLPVCKSIKEPITDGYFWISFDELIKDEKTILNNRDIILLLLENRGKLFDDAVDYYV